MWLGLNASQPGRPLRSKMYFRLSLLNETPETYEVCALYYGPATVRALVIPSGFQVEAPDVPGTGGWCFG